MIYSTYLQNTFCKCTVHIYRHIRYVLQIFVQVSVQMHQMTSMARSQCFPMLHPLPPWQRSLYHCDSMPKMCLLSLSFCVSLCTSFYWCVVLRIHCDIAFYFSFNILICFCVHVYICFCAESTTVCLCANVLLCVTELLCFGVTAYFAAIWFLYHSKNAKVNMCHKFRWLAPLFLPVLCQCAWALCFVLFWLCSLLIWSAIGSALESTIGTMNDEFLPYERFPLGSGGGPSWPRLL
jgi:hypothetical protein